MPSTGSADFTAGYGKTTLLAQWSAESGRPCAWVTLDSADEDADILAASIANALDTVGMATWPATQF